MEEILFVVKPELIVAMALASYMHDEEVRCRCLGAGHYSSVLLSSDLLCNVPAWFAARAKNCTFQVVRVSGALRFSAYTGYASTFTFAGDWEGFEVQLVCEVCKRVRVPEDTLLI